MKTKKMMQGEIESLRAQVSTLTEENERLKDALLTIRIQLAALNNKTKEVKNNVDFRSDYN